MAHVVALDLTADSTFVDTVRAIWDRGDAVLPLDRRLPNAARDLVMTTLQPTRIVDSYGERSIPGLQTESGDAVVMATSGSTGTPKGVVLTHAALAASARATTERLGAVVDDRWLACLPMSHIGGFSVLTKAIYSGTALTVLPGFDAAAVTDAAAQGCTLVSLVATALQRVDTAAFRAIVVGGSRPPAMVAANVHTTYGMTETGSGVVYDRQPLADVEVAAAADGELLVRCPMLMRCYRDGSTTIDEAGWLHTGDIGSVETATQLVDVVGRRDDVIITGGENVWPDAVERVLAQHPAVAEVAIAGVDDPEWGHRVVAWIVPAPDAAIPQLDELREWTAATLPAYAAPKQLILVDELPTNTNGKVLRSRLVQPRPR